MLGFEPRCRAPRSSGISLTLNFEPFLFSEPASLFGADSRYAIWVLRCWTRDPVSEIYDPSSEIHDLKSDIRDPKSEITSLFRESQSLDRHRLAIVG